MYKIYEPNSVDYKEYQFLKQVRSSYNYSC